MFFIFLLIFLIIIAIFLSIFSILAYHLSKYRLPEQDHSKKVIIVFSIGSVIFILISILLFFNIPWELLNQ